MIIQPYYSNTNFKLYLGDCVEILRSLKISPNVVFADPPYFLSDEGFTIQSGKIVSVKKGEWDYLKNKTIDEFNFEWLKAVKDVMPKGGTIWVSGTFHNIFSIARQITELNFKILNIITWQKTNPPPNYTKRVFTHSAEIIIWARKEESTPHYFNYELMKALNDSKQMQDVWKLPAIAPWEKKMGKHPTQKPLSILSRVILSSSKKGDLVLDPFSGSSTTGIAANLFGRHYIGIDTCEEFLQISLNRKKELENTTYDSTISKIKSLDYKKIQSLDL